MAFLFVGFAAYAAQLWIVEKIVLNGNRALSNSQISDAMELRPAGLFVKTEYSFSALIRDIEQIESLYRSRGFLNARVSISQIALDSASYRVSIALSIHEGSRTLVDSILFVGNTSLSETKLEALVSIRKGDPLDSSEQARARSRIHSALASRGYLFANVTSNVALEDTSRGATITFTILENQLVFAGDPEIIGNEKVRTSVIRRELIFASGELLTSAIIDHSRQRILHTGLFDLVRIEPIDTSTRSTVGQDTIMVPVLIQVRERDMLAYLIGAGYDSYESFFVNAEIAYRNLFRLGHRISLSANASKARLGTQVSYTYPWLFSIPLLAEFALFIERREQDSYEGLFQGGTAYFTGQLGHHSIYRTWTRVERITNFEQLSSTPRFPAFPIRNTALVGFGLRRDTRLDLQRLQTGMYANFETELAGPGMQWSNQFYRIQGDLRGYVAFSEERFSIAGALFAGYVNGYASDAGRVPPQELYRIGFSPARPIRGYEEKDVSPIDEAGTTRGGRLAVALTPLEFSFPIYRILRGALFIDAGYLWLSRQDFSLIDLRWSTGPGIRIALPAGLIRFDYGIQIRSNTDFQGKLHVGIGLPF